LRILCLHFSTLDPELWIVWVQKNTDRMLFAVLVLGRRKRLSRAGCSSTFFWISSGNTVSVGRRAGLC
jgi:hypothetical protein